MQRFLEALKYIDDCGLTLIQFLILNESLNGESHHMAGIANKLNRTASAMTPAADFLFKRGFAQRVVIPEDRRRFYLEATDDGVNIVNRVKHILVG